MYLTIFKKADVFDLLVYAPVDYRSLIDAELFARRLVHEKYTTLINQFFLDNEK